MAAIGAAIRIWSCSWSWSLSAAATHGEEAIKLIKVKRCGLCNQKEKKISIDSAGEHDFSPHGAHRSTPDAHAHSCLVCGCCCNIVTAVAASYCCCFYCKLSLLLLGLLVCLSLCLFVCFSLWTSAWAHEQLPEGTQHEPRPCGQAQSQATSTPAIADNKHGSRQRLVAFIRQTCRQDAQRHGRPSSSSSFSCCLLPVCRLPSSSLAECSCSCSGEDCVGRVRRCSLRPMGAIRIAIVRCTTPPIQFKGAI